MAVQAPHKWIAFGVALLLAVSWPLALASRAAAGPAGSQASQGEKKKEEKELGAEAEGLSQQQQGLLVRTLNLALLGAGIHPDQLSQAEREQIAQVSGFSVQQVNSSLATVESYLGKDNPGGQFPVSGPIVFIFIATALIFIPTIFATSGGTLFGGDTETGGSEGIGEFGK